MPPGFALSSRFQKSLKTHSQVSESQFLIGSCNLYRRINNKINSTQCCCCMNISLSTSPSPSQLIIKGGQQEERTNLKERMLPGQKQSCQCCQKAARTPKAIKIHKRLEKLPECYRSFHMHRSRRQVTTLLTLFVG